jgi:alcohol dehydrogenase
MAGNGFNYNPHTRLIFGEGALDTLGELVKEYDGKRVLLVTDSGVAKAGHAARAEQSIAKAGLSVLLFDKVRENPGTSQVADCVAAARTRDVDFIVGLGGGSSMDTAKGANFILTNGGKMADYWGVNKATRPMLPLIAIPTTAGTGSECQSYALITDETTHQKMACGDDKAYARVALLDPLLTLSQPQRVTANTGIDTVTHALESHVTSIRSPISQLFSRESWKLAESSLETVLAEPKNLAARGQMLLASAYGGTAIAQSMLGAVHSAANPLTAHYNIVHGQAVGIMLPHVIRFNSRDPQAQNLYLDLAATAGLARREDDPEQTLSSILARIIGLLAAAEIPDSLKECGVPRDSIPKLAEEAARQWTATFNPAKITAADFKAVYEAAWESRRQTLNIPAGKSATRKEDQV